jgi:hypothetical protein
VWPAVAFGLALAALRRVAVVLLALGYVAAQFAWWGFSSGPLP